MEKISSLRQLWAASSLPALTVPACNLIATQHRKRLQTMTEVGAFARGRTWLASGLDEMTQGIRAWRVSHLMGLNEIRRRYARSKIGQFWVTISTAIMVTALGLVWSVLWKVPLAELVPFISISLILWGLITGTVGEAATTFVQSGPMFLNQGMCFSTAIYALVYRNLLIFAHNLPIIAVAMIVFSVPLGTGALLALPGFVIMSIALLWLAYVVAIACVRFRDLTQLVQSGLLIAFFITPVMWKPEQIPADSQILLLNPFAALLAIVREPLLGQYPPLRDWLVAIVFSLGGLLLALPLIGYCRRRIIYWI
jgi:homopolymeric O-antigen transport system permease protein